MSNERANTISSSEFGKLFTEYKPRFVVVARSYVRDAVVAEDIVADFCGIPGNTHCIHKTISAGGWERY